MSDKFEFIDAEYADNWCVGACGSHFRAAGLHSGLRCLRVVDAVGGGAHTRGWRRGLWHAAVPAHRLGLRRVCDSAAAAVREDLRTSRTSRPRPSRWPV
jgi:hypothetical protein